MCSCLFPTNSKGSFTYLWAIGISEITDSLTVVVSEETGTISFAIKGELIKIPRKELRASLVNELGWFKSEDEEGDEDE